MKCPICQTGLKGSGGILSCPKRHGTLISGEELTEIKHLRLNDPAGNEGNSIKDINCPNCGTVMQKVNYNDTGIIIDACMNCVYRWLDSGEIAKISEFKPKIKPEDLLFLGDLKQKIQIIDDNPSDDPNPELPLYNSVKGGAIRGYAAGSDDRTLAFLITETMYGLADGMRKSKLIRILAPIVVIGFLVLGYYILKQIIIVTSHPFR